MIRICNASMFPLRCSNIIELATDLKGIHAWWVIGIVCNIFGFMQREIKIIKDMVRDNLQIHVSIK